MQYSHATGIMLMITEIYFTRAKLGTLVSVWVCLCICLSVTRRYCVKRLNRSRSFLARRLPSAYPVQC